jgi:hypothetical protein
MLEERSLGLLERFYFSFEGTGGTNFVGIMEFSSRLNREWLVERLREVQRRFWILQVRLDRSCPHGPVLTRSNVGAIPLQEELVGKNCILASVARELQGEFSSHPCAPLMRCLLAIHSDGTSTLVVTLSHGLADGFTGLLIMKSLLDVDCRMCFSEIELAENLIPKRLRGFEGLLRAARTLPQRVLKRRRLLSIPSPCLGKDVSRRPVLFSSSLEKGETAALLRLIRLHALSVHDALCAAQILALAQLIRQEGVVAVSSGVNLRRGRRLRLGLAGLLSCGLLTFHEAKLGDSFWDLAKRIKENKVRELRSGEPYLGLNVVMSLMRLLSSPLGTMFIGRGLFNFIIRRALPWHMPITYLGDLTVDEGGAAIYPEAVSAAFWGPPDWSFGSIANIFNGRLYWNFIGVDPEIDSTQVETLGNAVLRSLRVGAGLVSAGTLLCPRCELDRD